MLQLTLSEAALAAGILALLGAAATAILVAARGVMLERGAAAKRAEIEKRLREREEQFETFFAVCPEALAVVRYEDGVYVDVNEAWLRKFGYVAGEVVGHTAYELDIWTDLSQRRTILAELKATGGVDAGEAWFQTKGGKLLLAEVSARLFDLGGTRYVLWDAHDITETRRAETELQVSREKFAKAFHGSPDYISISRLEDGLLVEANDAFERFTGYSREEAIGRTALDLGLWPRAGERSEFARILVETGSVRDFACILGDRYGQQRHARVTASAIEMDGARCVIAIARDVTEQLRMEQALREGEAKFSAIFHHSPVALAVAQVPTGRYIDVNEAWTTQFGYSRKSMIGKTSIDLGLWLDPAERARLFDDLAHGTEVRSREVRFRRGDGVEILCELSAHVVELNSEQVLIWGAHDVTEHRRAQQEIRDLNVQLEARVRERTSRLQGANEELASALEALKLTQDELVRSEKLAALGSLVAGVAHELNTPIGNCVTVASALLDKTRDFTEETQFGPLRRSALDGFLSATRMATELLMRSLSQANELVSSFKQVAVDRTSAQRRRFELGMAIEEIAATLAPMLRKTPFKFELEIADKIVMDGFPGPLGQVITNFVTNSLAHGFEGRSHGVIRLAARRSDGDGVELVFSDDGIGIPEADLKFVFDPFYTTKMGRGGSGLGLHIVYSIVTRVLGGKIQVTSGEGAGTRFTLLLPVKAPESGEREAFA